MGDGSKSPSRSWREELLLTSRFVRTDFSAGRIWNFAMWGSSLWVDLVSTTTRTNRHQEGFIDRVSRAKSPEVWIYRWRELLLDGTRIQQKKTIGDIKRFPTRSDVQREVTNLRAEINSRQELIGKMTIRELWSDFQAKKLPSPYADRSPATIECYLENFKRYIIPHNGVTTIDQGKAVGVENWLTSLPYAPATKARFRNQLSCLYAHAIRHEHWKGTHPIASVRQGSKRFFDFLIDSHTLSPCSYSA